MANETQGQLTQLSIEPGPSLAAIPTPAPTAEEVAPMVLASNDVQTAQARLAAQPSPTIKQDSYAVVVKAPPAGGMLAYLVGPGAQIQLEGIDLNKSTVSQEGGNLRITTANGAEVLLLDYVNSAKDPSTVVITEDGKLPAQQLLAALDATEIAQKVADVEPAAGPGAGSAGGGLLPPTILGTGVGSGEGIFSSVIGPFALPVPYDTIKTEPYLEGRAPDIVIPADQLPPTARNDMFSTAVNKPITITFPQLLANDSDPEGDPLTVISVQGAEHGTVSIVNGQVVFTPAPGFHGTGSFSYTITDGRGGTSTADVLIQIDPDPSNENNVIAADDSDKVLAGKAVTVDVLSNDSDPEGDALVPGSVRLVSQPRLDNGQPAGGTVSIDAATGKITYNAPAAAAGVTYPYFVTFVYEVADAKGARDTATVTIEVLNPTTEANSVDAIDDTGSIQPAGATKSFNVVANDVDPQGDTFKIISIGSPMSNGQVVGSASFNAATGEITYNSVNGNGSYTVTISYTIEDARGATDTATLTIHVTPDGMNNVIAADDTADLKAGEEVRIDVLRNDTDPQGDSFSIVPGSVTQPRDINGNVRGEAILNTDGTITFRDADGARNSGVVEFTYTIIDSKGATDTAVVRVTIGTAANGVDANNDTLTIAENAPEANITNTLLANDFDPQNDGFKITSVGALTLGQGTLRFDAATNQVFFTPANGYHGPVEFTYTITDDRGATDTALVHINVQKALDGLNAGDDSFATPFETPITITSAQILANDYDPDGTVLGAGNIISYNFTETAKGTLTRGADGNFIFTPADGFSGNVTFTYTIRDDQGETDTAVVVIRVGEPTDIPLDNPVNAENDLMIVHAGRTQELNVLTNDTAPDGGLAFVRYIGTLPAGFTDLGGGRFSFTAPMQDPNGKEYTFQYEVRDADGDTDIATVVIRVVDNPVDAKDDVFTTNEDTPLNFTVSDILANDVALDGGKEFVRIVGNLPAGLTFDGTNFNYNPPADWHGSVSFQYEVRDFDGDTDIATVTINVDNVNDPVFANDDVFTTPEDTRLDFTVADILSNDRAPDGGLAFVRIVGNLPAGLTFDSATGQFTYNPPADWHGSVSFQYEVRDVDGDTDIATVVINVTPVNDPVFANDDAFSTIQRVPIDFTVGQLLSNDSAPDGGLAFVRIVGNLPAGLTFDGTNFHYNPPANVTGNVTFQYEVRDVDGDTDIATVTINVRPNSVTAVDDIVTMPKDVNSILINAIANDFDPQGDAFSITRIVSVSTGTASIENGQIRYNNPTRFDGAATIVYEITDQYGATSQATIHVTIVADTNTVVAVDDQVNMAKDVNSILIDAKANDYDPEGDAFSITRIVSVSSGTASIENGQIRYTNPTRFDGTATIVYEITDQYGAKDTATITVKIAADSNDVVAVDDQVTMAKDVNSILINAIANDYDPQGDTFSITRIVSVSSGSASIENGQIRYNNPTREAGTATIVYEITDQYGAKDTATITVKIEADSNDVVAVDDLVTMPSNQNSILIDAKANDYDPQGDAFSITRIVSVSSGTASIENGQIRYNNPTRGAGTATIVYEITDQYGAKDTATITVKIEADVNNVVAVDDYVTMPRDVNSILVNAIANDYDPQGDAFSITRIVSVNGGGSARIENGQIRYENGTRDAGNATIVYEITDQYGATSQATVHVNIEADSNNVVAQNDWASVGSRGSVNINVLANDYDPQGDAFWVTGIVSGPSIGSVRVEGNGTITYVAGSTNVAYTTSFVYEIRDSRGAISHATVTVNVAAGQTWGGGGNDGGGGGGGGGGDCPLVIDLNGDGISIAMRSQSTAHFDLNGDGFAEWTSWVNGSDDAILAIDRNGNGTIDGINEVFGGPGVDGFTELARLEDSNHDGVVDSNDANWSQLRLWLDVNGDGIGQADELFTLDHFGIVAINLTSTGTSIQYGDAYIDRVGTVVKEDGSTLNAGSVFYTNNSNGHLTGTANNDILIYSSAADTIDGGQGADTLKVLTASDIVISHDNVHSVEHIDLANNGADKLTLNINDVLGMSDNGILTIKGDAVDEITLNGDLTRGDNVSQGGHDYASYVAANGGTVLVELGLTVHTLEQNNH